MRHVNKRRLLLRIPGPVPFYLQSSLHQSHSYTNCNFLDYKHLSSQGIFSNLRLTNCIFRSRSLQISVIEVAKPITPQAKSLLSTTSLLLPWITNSCCLNTYNHHESQDIDVESCFCIVKQFSKLCLQNGNLLIAKVILDKTLFTVIKQSSNRQREWNSNNQEFVHFEYRISAKVTNNRNLIKNQNKSISSTNFKLKYWLIVLQNFQQQN